ncbi:MAG TPA: hypothetical protein IAC82_08025 [Candidatus Merdivicinus intestinigallinarum]|nr:hypothetical protein [Candidatus Merdivicinus intestinigallinarum]
MDTNENVWSYVLKMEQEMPEAQLALNRVLDDVKGLLRPSDWQEIESLWNQACSVSEYQGFLIGLRTALGLVYQTM